MICLRPFAVRIPQTAATACCAAATATRRTRHLSAAASWQQGGAQRKDRNQVAAAAAADKQQPMEVEVKLRLPGEEAHKQLADLLAPGHVATHQQENYFFDGPNRELNSRRVVLRLRFYDTNKKAVITLKGEQVLKDGIGRASEVEELVDPVAARHYLQQPDTLLQHPSDLMQSLAQQYNLSSLISLGGFDNTRIEAQWQGFTLELDRTVYSWGTLYELEAETDKPEELRSKLETMLQSQRISYSYSKTSKFANFINKTLL